MRTKGISCNKMDRISLQKNGVPLPHPGWCLYPRVDVYTRKDLPVISFPLILWNRRVLGKLCSLECTLTVVGMPTDPPRDSPADTVVQRECRTAGDVTVQSNG